MMACHDVTRATTKKLLKYTSYFNKKKYVGVECDAHKNNLEKRYARLKTFGSLTFWREIDSILHHSFIRHRLAVLGFDQKLISVNYNNTTYVIL
jgi:hypothetical protein